ncbi:hypothetical protein CPB83DRAFT_642014 [Crepidotus variabilis]|uniref:Uncharacterized protein n=1 Tax=Crepidotus variabilis TaxID=179855 RepID=A0A9P6JKB9_9AGAR|nr:hypothetical protein CPB83DRAFT_642014 [Crepidotus variabilis]
MSRRKKGLNPPRKLAPITAILNLLPKAAKLHHIHVGLDVSLGWESFTRSVQDSLRSVFQGRNMESISLQRLAELPANVFQNQRLRSIELEACSVDRSWKSKKLTFEALNLQDLHYAHNFPLLDIYSKPLKVEAMANLPSFLIPSGELAHRVWKRANH